MKEWSTLRSDLEGRNGSDGILSKVAEGSWAQSRAASTTDKSIQRADGLLRIAVVIIITMIFFAVTIVFLFVFFLVWLLSKEDIASYRVIRWV